MCDVISSVIQHYIKLQHKHQLQLDLSLLPFNAPQLAGGFFTLKRVFQVYDFVKCDRLSCLHCRLSALVASGLTDP